MDSLQFFPALVLGFAASLGLTPISRQIAMRLGVVDRPNQRKIHNDHKPLMGGLAIYAAFALALVLFSPPDHVGQLAALLAGAAFVALIGLLDDRYTLGIRVRLIATWIAATVVYFSGIAFTFTTFAPVNYFITVFWIMAITNAVNFLDNMDGLAAGLSAIAALFFMVIALAHGQILVSVLAAAMLGSAVGFLTYNYAPSSTFMGDMGALMLGFVLAVIAIKIDTVTPAISPRWFAPLLVLALPAFDINLVVWTRIAEGRSPGEAGKDHTSHRLMALGLHQRWTLAVLYAGCVFFGIAGLALTLAPEAEGWLLVAALAVLTGLLYRVMILVRRRYQLKPV
jgi:UDP-GlcNAc:undecaprenyl-phosphate GlcNAc-1-phosphate transferase